MCKPAEIPMGEDESEIIGEALDKTEEEMEDDSLYEEHTLTWKTFKEKVEAAGVTDAMEIVYIDWPSLTSEVQVVIYTDKKSFKVW